MPMTLVKYLQPGDHIAHGNSSMEIVSIHPTGRTKIEVYGKSWPWKRPIHAVWSSDREIVLHSTRDGRTLAIQASVDQEYVRAMDKLATATATAIGWASR